MGPSQPFLSILKGTENSYLTNCHINLFGQDWVAWSHPGARVSGKCYILSEQFPILNAFSIGLLNKEKWMADRQLLSLQVSCNQQEKVYWKNRCEIEKGGEGVNMFTFGDGIYNKYWSGIQMSSGQFNSWVKRKSKVSYIDLKVRW